MTDDELTATLQTIIEQNRQIIVMLGQWPAFGGYTNLPQQTNTYGQAQLVHSQEYANRGNPR